MRFASLGTLTVSTALMALVGACDDDTSYETKPGSSSSTSGGGNTTTTSVGGFGGSGAGGSGPSCPNSVDGEVFAMDRIFLGDTDWAGTPSVGAWKEFGRNLDSLTTEGGDLTGHCQPASGGPASALNDGTDGRDNSFGRNLLPLLISLEADFSKAVNANIEAGAFSLLLELVDLEDEADQSPLMTRLYGGAPLMPSPGWDGQDCWPLVREQLTNPNDPSSAKTTFSSATLQSNGYDSLTMGTVVVPISVAGLDVPLTIHHARITMDLSSAHDGATGGIIAGTLETEEYIEVMRLAFGAIDGAFCDGTTWLAVADQIRQASDIMKDGTQDDSATCDGISIGIGFEMAAAGLGTVASPAPPIVDPCE